MPLRTAAILIAACLSMALAGCRSPSTPSTTVASGQPTSPSNGPVLSYYSQPVTLVLANGVATGGASPTTTIEVATDFAFTAVVTTQTVSPNANGQLTITLNNLTPGTTYYWRVKTAAGNNPGVFSAPVSFSMGPLLVIQPPVPVQPLANTFPHKRPTFTVANAARNDPTVTLTYRFDVATDATFSTLVATGTVPEGPSQTSFTSSVDLVTGTSYVWRADASDTAKGVTSAYSAAQAFTTVNPDDGTYPYTLVVNVLTSCEFPYTTWTFDNALSVNGNTLQFIAPGYEGSAGLTVNLQRSGNQLSGTLSGSAAYQRLPTFLVFGGSAPSSPAVTTGSEDNAGRLAGGFTGGAYYDTVGLAYRYCYNAALDWMLMPQ
jgi:hypothetical protein